MKRDSAMGILLAPAVLLLLLGLSCSLFNSSGDIEFPPVGYLIISYNTDTTIVNAQTLLAEGGAPLNGYSWTLASGSTYPAGTTVDALTGVFKPTGGAVTHTAGTFKVHVTAGSNNGTSGSYTVKVMDYGTGPVPSAILQQWPTDVDPSALELIDAEPGKGYGASLFVLGGTPPYYWREDSSYSAGTDLSTVGLSIGYLNGVVSGTPPSSASGKTVRFRVVVRDATGDVAAYQPVYTINIQ